MKIRIKDNSIRLRLSKDDITLLSDEGCILADCQISPNNVLRYMISIAEGDEIKVKMKYHTIDVKVPMDLLTQFYADDQVGFDALVNNGSPSGLKILVEKDFQCLVPRKEDESNLYPNPAQS